MMTPGVVLARGRSSRFGSDKAEAIYESRKRLDHAIMALSPHCDRIAAAGRNCDTVLPLADWRQSGLGPLGGIAAALEYAARNRCSQMFTVSVGCIHLPEDIRAVLEPAPSYLDSQPAIGLWPTTASACLGHRPGSGEKLAVKALVSRIGASPVAAAFPPPNINRPGNPDALSAPYEGHV